MHDIKYAKYNSSVGFRVVGGTAAQFLKADGSVDSTSYVAAGTDINMADKNINFTSGSLSRFENLCRVFNKVYQRFTGTSQTGILSIKFPQVTASATMFDVTLKIYGYQNRFMGNIRLSFYKQTATYIHPSGSKAVIECSDTFPTNIINVGIDPAGQLCINIGDTTTFWNTYVMVEVERVVSHFTGHNNDYSKGWSQGIETDTSSYQTLLNIVPDVVASRSWVDLNNTGSVPKLPSLLAQADLNTFLTPGFYYQHSNSNATTANNYPSEGLFAGSLRVFKTLATGIVQEYQTRRSGGNITFIRSTDDNGATWSAWKRVLTTVDFVPANYYTKTEALNLFVGKTGVETIAGTKTFTESPIVPNATLNGHAVNFGQLDWLLGQTVSNFIPLGFKGQPYGVAELDADGKVPTSQLPYGGVIVDPVSGHVGIGGVSPTASHNIYLNGSIRITGGIYSESISGADIYAASGELYHLDKDVTQEDGSLRLSVYDRVFSGMSNTFDTDKRVIKITLIDGGTITLQNYFLYQEMTVMNVSGNDANFTIDNTPVNVSIPPKSSATFYVNSQNKIILVRLDNDYCGILN
ncbi:pyocin knob domain-containing protein [Chryseobacterium sp. CCH4-E10]|uniref:pyocin knob domain-containing protein n=1 Tax=Chryseobacterium sp. CCH4-E10 TaxID=1768758 RepID=UPI00082D47FC|nr:pyocin knob domain-containing protein [Chryseobacterium sp. CCH4-E10]